MRMSGGACFGDAAWVMPLAQPRACSACSTAHVIITSHAVTGRDKDHLTDLLHLLWCEIRQLRGRAAMHHLVSQRHGGHGLQALEHRLD